MFRSSEDFGGFSPRGLVFREGAFRLISGGSPPGAGPRTGRGEAAAPADAIWLPGFANAHSHAFQRVLRGRVEGHGDDFWGWRERMYHAALRLGPDEIRIASRAAFLEMVLAGYTGVIEFHYLHHDPEGHPYAEPNELAVAVLEAAAEVGIRICLLEAAYARGGWGGKLDPAQRRFVDPTPEAFLRRAASLRERVEQVAHVGGSRTHGAARASFGVALHSVRALPAEWLREIGAWGRQAGVPLHAHVAEQSAEVEACVAEHGCRPVELLDRLGLLGRGFTAIHAIHLTENEVQLLARSGAGVCACPSTEANLGDGFVPARALVAAGVPLSLGTDSHASIDPFVEVRELEYRERLRSGRRTGTALPAELLEIASRGGATAGWGPSQVEGDWIRLDETCPALAGASPQDLAGHVLAAGTPALVRDVWVAGTPVVSGGRHARQEEILEDFRALQARLW